MGASTPMAGLLIFCLVVFCRCLRKDGIEIPAIPMGFYFLAFGPCCLGVLGDSLNNPVTSGRFLENHF
jgi:hypothetical protein